MEQMFVAVVHVHSESVCRSIESVWCDQVAIGRDQGDPGPDLEVTGQQALGIATSF